MTTDSYTQLTKNVSGNLMSLQKGIPEVMKSFSALNKAGSAAGTLDEKTKELIALAVAVACRCDACIGFHVKSLIRLGGTEAELQEMLGVAIYMGGGPSVMYASNTIAAFREFSSASLP